MTGKTISVLQLLSVLPLLSVPLSLTVRVPEIPELTGQANAARLDVGANEDALQDGTTIVLLCLI